MDDLFKSLTAWCFIFNMALYVGHWKSSISLSLLHIWAMKVNSVHVGVATAVCCLSVEDGSDLNLNQISFLTLTVAHSSSLSTPLTHINMHIFVCTHPSCCTPTQRKCVGYKSKLYPVWVFSWCLWQLNRQGNNCLILNLQHWLGMLERKLACILRKITMILYIFTGSATSSSWPVPLYFN